MNKNILRMAALSAVAISLAACGSKDGKPAEDGQEPMVVNAQGETMAADSAKGGVEQALPYTDDVTERVVLDYGNRTIRTTPDKTISMPEKMKDKAKCFIVMSKKDYYLYVYEPQGQDTVMLARFDCAFSLKKGQKEMSGDMKTPHCTMDTPFSIQEIVPASTWTHDFGDGRGSIKSYGDYFLRLVTPGHKGIGIHGSTNNRESVPGRASEGCIRLKDEDIKTLTETYATTGMKVVIKAENIDDLPFEIHAFQKQGIERKRHFDPRKTLTNEQLATAPTEQGRVSGQPTAEEPTATAAEPATGAAPHSVEVTAKSVNLRLGPSPDQPRLTDDKGNPFYPNKGDRLTCKAKVGDWYMVTFQGKTVYINKQFVREVK